MRKSTVIILGAAIGLILSALSIWPYGVTMAIATPSGWFEVFPRDVGFAIWNLFVVNGLAIGIASALLGFAYGRFFPAKAMALVLATLIGLWVGHYVMMPMYYYDPAILGLAHWKGLNFFRPWWDHGFEFMSMAGLLGIAWLASRSARTSPVG